MVSSPNQFESVTEEGSLGTSGGFKSGAERRGAGRAGLGSAAATGAAGGASGGALGIGTAGGALVGGAAATRKAWEQIRQETTVPAGSSIPKFSKELQCGQISCVLFMA
jgi:hypothetical protein